ncbi:MAG: hypothetical protein ACFFAN_02400 [Promethearchaeota archaeon]
MKNLEITRNSPNGGEILELYRKEKNSKLKEIYTAIYLMLEFENCTKLVKLLGKHRPTVIGGVKEFNEKGLETIIPQKPLNRPSSFSK